MLLQTNNVDVWKKEINSLIISKINFGYMIKLPLEVKLTTLNCSSEIILAMISLYHHYRDHRIFSAILLMFCKINDEMTGETGTFRIRHQHTFKVFAWYRNTLFTESASMAKYPLGPPGSPGYDEDGTPGIPGLDGLPGFLTKYQDGKCIECRHGLPGM
ncbi:unnamed protein product, partial [Brugia timori]|uniref:Col_cuticle_N domain-containing protein n=1 Tax=Brugia timori TaxID=42155 RepID=A0A0R3QTD1_9BILA